jgi:hypothetical protein
MAVPVVPGTGLVVVEAELVLGSLEVVLNRPAITLDLDQRFDRSPCWAPGGEVGEIAVGDVAPDQHASGPGVMVFCAELLGFEIGKFKITPIRQSRPLGSGACRQTLPVGQLKRLSNSRSAWRL